MKLPSFLLALAFITTLTTYVTAHKFHLSGHKGKYPNVDSGICKDKHLHAYNAIDHFCNHPHVIVPSAYAEKGKHVGNTFVEIRGSLRCTGPPQRVSRKQCRKRFFDICAKGNGTGTRQFGRCQQFRIGKITLQLAGRDEESADVEACEDDDE